MDISHHPEDGAGAVHRMTASRAAVEAFFTYCQVADGLRQNGDPPFTRKKKRAKKLLH